MKQLLLSATLVASAASALAQTPTSSSPYSARAVFMDREGRTIGTATLINTPNGILIRAEAANVPPGLHGFHIHEVGRCDATTGFESAGEHFNPRSAKHGFWLEDGPHAGDMSNQSVSQDGKLVAEVFNSNVSFRKDETTIFDQDGSALVIHADADDYRSQPSGAAEDRIACGVIQRDR